MEDIYENLHEDEVEIVKPNFSALNISNINNILKRV